MTGFYGKVPVKGDFVCRGLNRQLVDEFHNWFQQGLEQSQLDLKEQWLPLYSVAPIWHFYLPPGLVSDESWVGIWLPSEDRVGRRFPLLVMDQLNESLTAPAEIREFFDWFVECEEILLCVFDEQVDFDQFCNRVCEKSSYRKIVKPDDIDDVFEMVGVTQITSDESPDAGTKLSSDELTPSTPLEKALMTQVNLLQSIVQKICDKVGIDFAQELEGFIDGLCDEQKQIKTDGVPSSPIKHGSSPDTKISDDKESTAQPTGRFEYEKNVVALPEVYDTEEINQAAHQYCIWISEGSEDIGPQLVFTRDLPDKSIFHSFLSGFEHV